MGVLAEAFHPRSMADASPPPEDHDFWYQDAAVWFLQSGSRGLSLTPETIFYCGTVLAAIRFLADAWAMCPPHVIRELSGNRREQNRDHYLHRVLRRPNMWQGGYRWRHLNMVWVSTWGNSFNRIVGGRTAFVEELRPLHPSRVRVTSQNADGTLNYLFRPENGPEERLRQDDVLHFRGLSTDGFSGLPIYQLIRNLVMIALLAEGHAAAFLKKGSRISGLLVPSTPLADDERKLLRDSANKDMGGVNSTGTFGILPFGVELKPISNTNREAQFAELSDQTVGAILRTLGVPGVVVGFMGDKTATYASAKEFFESGGIKHCILPWVENFEDEIDFTLMVEGDPHQVKYSLEVLLRASMTARYAALYQAAGRPWMTGNEVRVYEDLNPLPQEDMDEVAQPSNMTGSGSAPAPGSPDELAPRPALPLPSPDEDVEDDDAAAIARRSLVALERAERRQRRQAQRDAARVVRREKAAILGVKGSKGAAARFAKDPEGFKQWARDYYEAHVEHVMESLELDEKEARDYATRQREALIAGGVRVVEGWEETVVPQLAALALGETA